VLLILKLLEKLQTKMFLPTIPLNRLKAEAFTVPTAGSPYMQSSQDIPISDCLIYMFCLRLLTENFWIVSPLLRENTASDNRLNVGRSIFPSTWLHRGTSFLIQGAHLF
jgi:hypothetical protein